MTRAAPRIALAAGSLALALLGVEAGLRLAGVEPLGAGGRRATLVRVSAFPGRGYELVPGAEGAAFGTHVAVNARGFRGPDVDPEARGRERVVALGDSVTFGNDLAYDEAWPAVLARELAAAGRAADVLNLGLGGYDTVQAVATLEALGLAYRPAHVVLGYCVNDVGVVTMALDAPTAAGAFPLLGSSRLVQWLLVRHDRRERLRALGAANREAEYARTFAGEIAPLDAFPEIAERVRVLRADVARTPPADAELAARRVPARWYASDARMGRLAHAFGRLRALADAHGFEVTVLVIPYLAEDLLIERGLGIVAALAEAHGFAVVAPAAELRALGFARLRLLPDDPVHPDARGHAALGRAVARALVARADG